MERMQVMDKKMELILLIAALMLVTANGCDALAPQTTIVKIAVSLPLEYDFARNMHGSS